MAVVITSTTSSQADMDHAVSDNWREAPAEVLEPKPAPAKEPEPEVPEAEPETKEPEIETKPESEAVVKPQPHKSGWQKRIDKLTAQNYQIKTEAENLRAENERLKAQAAKPDGEAKAADSGPREPKLSDFEGDVEKFVAARDQWKENVEKQVAQAEQRKAIVAEYNKKASEALGRYDDWNEVVNGADVIMPQAALDAIIEADNGPDIAYYLAQHRDEAEQFVDMTPIRAIQHVAKLSEKIAAELAPQPKPPKAKVPEPIKPVGSSATRHSTMEEIPIRDYIRIRNKQEREARRG